MEEVLLILCFLYWERFRGKKKVELKEWSAHYWLFPVSLSSKQWCTFDVYLIKAEKTRTTERLEKMYLARPNNTQGQHEKPSTLNSENIMGKPVLTPGQMRPSRGPVGMSRTITQHMAPIQASLHRSQLPRPVLFLGCEERGNVDGQGCDSPHTLAPTRVRA